MIDLRAEECAAAVAALAAVFAYGSAVYGATAKPRAPRRDPAPPAFDATPEWVRRMEGRT